MDTRAELLDVCRKCRIRVKKGCSHRALRTAIANAVLRDKAVDQISRTHDSPELRDAVADVYRLLPGFVNGSVPWAWLGDAIVHAVRVRDELLFAEAVTGLERKGAIKRDGETLSLA